MLNVNPKLKFPRLFKLIFTLALGAIVTNVACAADSNPLFAKLSKQIQERKVLLVNTAGSYPPLEYTDDSGKIIGFEADLVREIAKKLGVTADFKINSFDSVIPSLQGGRYDLAIHGILDKKERHDRVTFLDVLNTSTSFLVRKDNKKTTNINALDDLCGLKGAAIAGESQVKDLEAASERCKKANKPAVDIFTYTDPSDERIALMSRRIDVIVGGTPSLEYFASKTPDVKVVGTPYRLFTYGIAMNKSETGLHEAAREALEQLMNEGIYQKLLTKYGLNRGGLVKAILNGGK